jgi:glycosyltransferase involved in cell wall biosynthesis
MADLRVVVLGHAADRTGPPVYLLQLLRALDRTGLHLTVVLLRGGELLSELQELAEVRVIGEPADPAVASPTLLAGEPARVRARKAQLGDLHDVDVLLVNTAWSIHALSWLPERPARVVSVVHELGAGVADLLGPGALAALLASDGFVAGCAAVSRMLTEELAVAPERVVLIPYGVEIGAVDHPAADRAAVAAGEHDFVVVAAGVPDRRKGPDLFVHLAATARRRRPDIAWAFRWVGADDGDPRLADAREDRTLLDLVDVVRFIPPTSELRSLLATCDAFVLPSREDAFPLAAIEAALAGLPLLCFASGGIGALVEPDGGELVPFPDLEAIADRLIAWHDDPAARSAAGSAARGRARCNHDIVDHARSFDASVLGDRLGAPSRRRPG